MNPLARLAGFCVFKWFCDYYPQIVAFISLYLRKKFIFNLSLSVKVITELMENLNNLKLATGAGATVHKMTLSSQLRCNGSDGYLAWLDDIRD